MNMPTHLTKELLAQNLLPTIEQPLANDLQASAVLVLVMEANHGLDLVLTRRAYHLKNHPGQISFAGGVYDEQDSDLYQTALREAEEEIGLPSESVEVLGSFKGNETSSGFYMTPIVGFSYYQNPWQTDPNEVHSVLRIPLDWAMNAEHWRKESAYSHGEKNHYLASWWQGQLIWGATAQLLENLRCQLETCSLNLGYASVNDNRIIPC